MTDIELIKAMYPTIERIQDESSEADDLDELLKLGCALEDLSEYVKDAMLGIHTRIREIRDAEQERLAHKLYRYRV